MGVIIKSTKPFGGRRYMAAYANSFERATSQESVLLGKPNFKFSSSSRNGASVKTAAKSCLPFLRIAAFESKYGVVPSSSRDLETYHLHRDAQTQTDRTRRKAGSSALDVMMVLRFAIPPSHRSKAKHRNAWKLLDNTNMRFDVWSAG